MSQAQAVCSAAQRRRPFPRPLCPPSNAAKVGKHANAVAGDDHSVGAQPRCLAADGLRDARGGAVHLQAQQQLLVVHAC